MQKAIVSCARTRDVKIFAPGAVSGNCSKCSESVWLAPSTVALLKSQPHVQVVCIQCASDVIGDKPAVFAFAPGALEELVNLKKGVHNN